MHEYITLIRSLNETIAFLVIKPLYSAFHFTSFPSLTFDLLPVYYFVNTLEIIKTPMIQLSQRPLDTETNKYYRLSDLVYQKS
jgi:hypothetical protein